MGREGKYKGKKEERKREKKEERTVEVTMKYLCYIRLFPHLFMNGFQGFFMKKSSLVVLTVMVSLCVAPQDTGTDHYPHEKVTSAYDLSEVDRLLEREAPRNGGMALILVKEGEVIYDKGFSRMTTDSVIPVASATKWLSAGVIMALVDEGVLSLDDTASMYLDTYTGEHGDMTVRQLFSHTSGLPGGESGGRPGESEILQNRKITLAESADMIAEVELLADPGTQFCYGGLSMQVAGRIAEVASGKEWTLLFEEKVAAPLGMTKTDYQGLGPTKNPRIAGSIRTSARQYAQYLQMLLSGGMYEGKRVLSQETVNEMLRDQTFGVPIACSPWQKYENIFPEVGEVRYGIGCWREVVDETGRLKEASSQGAFGFSPWIDVDRNLAGVLAVKSSFTKVMPVYLEMKEIIRKCIDAETSKVPFITRVMDMNLPADVEMALSDDTVCSSTPKTTILPFSRISNQVVRPHFSAVTPGLPPFLCQDQN